MDSKNFNSLEIDAIGEILNISLGASATAVSTMLSKRVDITTPNVSVVSYDEFEFAEIEPAIGVEITYVSGLSGSNIMLLKRHDVKVICEILMGMEVSDEEFELNEMNLSAVCEVMNQMMGASSTALSEFLGEVVNISTPVSFEIPDLESFKKKYFGDEDEKVVAYFKLKIEGAIESQFMNLMSISLAKKLLSAFSIGMDDSILRDDTTKSEEPAATTSSLSSMPETPSAASGGVMSQEEIEKLMSGMGTGAADGTSTPSAASSGVMSQEEIEKLMSGMGNGVPSGAPTPTPASSGTMSQEEIEKLMSGMGNGGAANTTVPPQSSSVPNMSMYPNQMPMYPPYGMYPNQMPMYPPYGMYPGMMPPGYGQPQPEKKEKAPKMINVKPVQSPQFEQKDGDSIGEEQTENLALIMDVPLEVSVEIGRAKKSVKDILELTSGSLVVLDKLAGEQVDIYANGQCIAKGDVVVVDDNFGVRITEIIKNSDFKLEGTGKE